MSELYTGYKTFEVEPSAIDQFYQKEELEILQHWDKRYAFYPNMYVELRAGKQTALGKVSKNSEFIHKIQAQQVEELVPRNREQVFALDALLDDKIPIVTLTGSAGTGKTILSLASMLHKVFEKKYGRIILTRPMSQVGKYQLGALPGDAQEKFHPYLLNYLTNLEQFGGGKNGVQYLLDRGEIEMVPLQLFRGASFNNCVVIADEVQVLNHHEMLTIGSRMGENSKLIIMGDLNQRDERIAKDKTGIYKMMNDLRIKESPLAASIELIKCERSETARLFAEVFEEQ